MCIHLPVNNRNTQQKSHTRLGFQVYFIIPSWNRDSATDTSYTAFDAPVSSIGVRHRASRSPSLLLADLADIFQKASRCSMLFLAKSSHCLGRKPTFRMIQDTDVTLVSKLEEKGISRRYWPRQQPEERRWSWRKVAAVSSGLRGRSCFMTNGESEKPLAKLPRGEVIPWKGDCQRRGLRTHR